MHGRICRCYGSGDREVGVLHGPFNPKQIISGQVSPRTTDLQNMAWAKAKTKQSRTADVDPKHPANNTEA